MTAPMTLPAPATFRTRSDGWTPDRRCLFLEAVAAGTRIEDACAIVGLSKASAYALRSRDQVFALGWSGAALRSREAIADELMGRVMVGQVETWILPDGSEGKRRRYDNRLGLALLTRLDRLAEQQDNVWRIEQPAAEAVRSVAHDFGGFLDLVEQGAADPATIDRFVDARIRQLRQLRSAERLTELMREADADAGSSGCAQARSPAFSPEKIEEAVRRLIESHEDDEAAAEADSTENGEGEAEPREEALVERPDEPDRKPVDARAEEAEAPVDACADNGKAECERDADGAARPWFDPTHEQWRTTLPPPAGFQGIESGESGQPGYWRTLTPVERETAEAQSGIVPAMLPVMRLSARERRRLRIS